MAAIGDRMLTATIPTADFTVSAMGTVGATAMVGATDIVAAMAHMERVVMPAAMELADMRAAMVAVFAVSPGVDAVSPGVAAPADLQVMQADSPVVAMAVAAADAKLEAH